MSLKDFQIVGKLGEGVYSSVYRVKRIEDGLTYALKRVKFANLSNKQRENALNEIRILASIRHSNIIAYRQAFIDQATKSLCIVMELASQGDLQRKIIDQKKKGGYLPQPQIWNVFIQSVRGLAELHRLNIFHRDIKPANIFIQDGNVVKLGDMNVSKITRRGFCMTSTGTPYYASPQVWKDEPYDQKSDIWSLGCVLYQLIALKPPFRGEDMQQLYKKVTRGIYARLPSQYSQDLSSIIRALLQTDPEMRPSCQKILAMPQVQRKIKSNPYQTSEQSELLRTIKAENFYALGDVLPKANYHPLKLKKAKGVKSLIDSLQEREKQMCQVESLPTLDRQKKIAPGQHSDRIVPKQKFNIIKDRKKSQIGSQRSGLEVNGLNYRLDDSKELKLPKVQNRYQKVKDRMSKQSSLKCHKPAEH